MVLVLNMLQKPLLTSLEAREDKAQEGSLATTVFQIDDGVRRLSTVRVGHVKYDAVVPGHINAVVADVDATNFLHIRQLWRLCFQSVPARRGGAA